jgi:hypothetical protein
MFFTLSGQLKSSRFACAVTVGKQFKCPPEWARDDIPFRQKSTIVQRRIAAERIKP